MGKTTDTLDAVRSQFDADEQALYEARTRLALVRTSAEKFQGALRSYASGSLAAHTMISPVSDGDGGVVLDRRFYPKLGPEGSGGSPADTVAALSDLIGPLIREQYPDARMYSSKRGPKITFGAPVNDQNPTVDLVVALTRKEGDGLWIPNLKKNVWEPSDPEKHISLLNSGTVALRSSRRKVIRLAKAWNNQFVNPGVSSFNLSVWGYEFVESGMGVAAGLHALFDGAARRLANHQPTPDPAGVSANLRLLIPADDAQRRLRKAADAVAEALDGPADQDSVTAALSRVFWNYLDSPDAPGLAAAASSLSLRVPIAASALGLASVAATIQPTRAYGSKR